MKFEELLHLVQNDVVFAEPEKALLDLIYLFPGADSYAFLKELRLNFDLIDTGKPCSFAEKINFPLFAIIANP